MALRAAIPNPELLLPMVLDCIASLPTAVLEPPEVLTLSAPKPTAVLNELAVPLPRPTVT